MALDPVLAGEVRAWITKARLDLRAAAVDLAAQPPLVEDALFHCQQAVEKAFKALLAMHQRQFRKTHSLEELGEQCLAIDTTLYDVVDEAVPLSEYAWLHRYPGPDRAPDAEEAELSLAVARRSVAAVEHRLPYETT
jgi:HEPN domain-containing protein